MNKQTLRDRIGLYLEDMNIVHGTVLQNIQLGDANITTEKIAAVTGQLGLEHFMAQFTNGLLTQISETDTQLSFSSRKIILLLRALLGKNRMILMEDPLDGLSPEVRQRLMDYITAEVKHKNIVIVTQDDEIINRAQQHLYLSQGNVEVLSPKN